MSRENWREAKTYMKGATFEMPKELKDLLSHIGFTDWAMPGVAYDEDAVAVAVQRLSPDKGVEFARQLENYLPVITGKAERASAEYSIADEALTKKLTEAGIFSPQNPDYEENPAAWPSDLQDEHRECENLRRESENLERIQSIILMLTDEIAKKG